MTPSRPQSSPGFVARAYLRYGLELQRFLSRRVHNEQDARDLAQEVWARLLRVGNPNEILEPLAYIYRTAANVIAEFRMRRRREYGSADPPVGELFGEPPAEVASDENAAERLERQVQLEQTLAKLPKTYRNILILKITRELSYREIGEQLDLSPKTVEQYFFRAMALVKRKQT